MDKLTNIITNYCVERKIIAEEKREIYSYGFKLIIADIVNYLIVIIIGMVFDRILESILFLISLCGLRQFCGGFHAKTFWLCRLSMMTTFACVILLTDLVLRTGQATIIIILLNLIDVIFISIFAPIEHPNKKLSDKQKHNNKIKSIIISISLTIASIVFVAVDMKFGVTISITLLSVIVLMIISIATKKGGKVNV